MRKSIKVAVLKSPFFIFILYFLILGKSFAQTPGCTDVLAENYNVNASFNDGSCSYSSISLSPEMSWDLPSDLLETSGLIQWNDQFWSHNDNNDATLFSFGLGSIPNPVPNVLNGLSTMDWEELGQDDNYVYLGDFGNNSAGNRTNLRIFRVLKSSIETILPEIDTIEFAYEDQIDFSSVSPNATNFDCEAFCVTSDSIYLFTKQWIDQKTSVYGMPKNPGSYTAIKRFTFDCGGLITGACLIDQSKVLMLTGYSQYLQPFVWLMYDFQGSDFFSANKRKVGIDLPFHQIEAVHSTNGTDIYMTNERFQQSTLVFPQKFHSFNFSTLLSTYLSASFSEKKKLQPIAVFPNPVSSDNLSFDAISSQFPLTVVVHDELGRQIGLKNTVNSANDLFYFPADSGVYSLMITANSGESYIIRLVKL